MGLVKRKTRFLVKKNVLKNGKKRNATKTKRKRNGNETKMVLGQIKRRYHCTTQCKIDIAKLLNYSNEYETFLTCVA